MIGPPPRTDDIKVLRDYVERLYNWIAYPDKFETQFIEMVELSTDVAAPGTNRVRIYAVDSGGGKTKLAARFATGAVQQLGVEP
jgi:hypothetical protein